MRADDPRHGQYKGYHQHLRDGDNVCEPCWEARRLYSMRRRKLRNMGRPAKVPVGEEGKATLEAARRMGLSYTQIGEAIGASMSVVWRLHQGPPEALIYTRTADKLANYRPAPTLTHEGMIRRIQALIWLGHTCRQIADKAGVHQESVTESLTVTRTSTMRMREAIAAAYTDLCMTVVPDSRFSARAKNRARREGWAPPLAWDCIDDPSEQPVMEREVAKIRTDYIDEAAVLRRMDGDRVKLNALEQAEVVHRMRRQGHTEHHIETVTGLNVRRAAA